MCSARRKDMTPCGSWVDKRRTTVCEYHLTRAVTAKRASRAEFAAGYAELASFARSY